MTQSILQRWQKDRLHTTMVWCWYATVITSFLGSTLISITVPAVGELFPFRIFLPMTALLYLIWAVRTREFVWRELSFVEKMTYALAVIMVVYGVASLPRAIEVGHTFVRLFNLCLDMVFFLLFLRLCRYQDIRKTTIRICLVMLAIMLVLGTWEVFFGGIWNPYYDDWKRFTFFNDIYQRLRLNIFEYSFREHDETIAYSLSIPFTSTLVFASIMKHQDAPGTTFKKHMDIARGLLSEDDYLLTEILFNPNTPQQVRQIQEQLSVLLDIVEQKDTDRMKEYLSRVRKNIE